MSAPSSLLAQVTSATFWEFIQRNRLAIIHFWAAWNGQDFVIGKLLEEIPKEVSRDVAFAQFDVDPPMHQEICRCHNVLNVPFLAFYRDGRLVRTITGMRTPQITIEHVKEFLNELAA